MPTNEGTAGVDTRGMVLIHRVLRRELGALPRLVRGAAGDAQRSALVARHAAEMFDFLHHHHAGEDLFLWPLLRKRVALDDGLVDRMEQQHETVAEQVAAVQSDLPGWGQTADATTGERIATVVESMNAVLDAHLDEEERRVLPLVAEHLTDAEWDALADHGFAAIPGKRRLVMLGHILEEADPAERAHMMQKVPPPARVAFRLLGHRQFRRETARVRTG